MSVVQPGAAPLGVLILSPGELFGGVETHVLGLASELRRRGVSVVPVLFHDLELAARLRESRLTPVILRSAHPYDPSACLALRQLLVTSRPDVLHVHGYRATLTAAFVGRKHLPPIVKTEHGLVESAGPPIARVKSRLYNLLDGWATRSLGAQVCYVTADLMRRHSRVHRDLPTCVIPNGIAPLERSGRRRPAALLPNAFHVGTIGRLTEVKNIPIALRALAEPSVPLKVHLNIIGTGHLENRLQDEARALGIQARVHFHGFQRNPLDWLAYMDVLLMPSTHEGLPYTLLEAMAMGVPVIASNVGGLAEVLRHGETGFLVDPTDVGGFARAITAAASSSDLIQRLGAAASSAQRKQYTITRMADDYLAVYTRALNARPA
jgi:glycosyltransferase involved in cell wall biosynthesis